jgi:Aspartyl protease/PDZ domain
VKRLAGLLSVFALMTLRIGFAQVHPCAVPVRKDFEMPPSGTVTVPAKGGVEFNAQVNGKGPFALIFDTGAGVNVLSTTAAKHLGLQVEGDPVQLSGAGGFTTARRAHVDTLQIDGLVLHDQTFYVMSLPWEPRGGPVGAVGYELLLRLAVKIDYEHQQLTFHEPSSFAYSGHGIKVPLDVVEQQLEVRGTVDGASGVFTIDTGDEASLELEPGFASQNDLANRLHAHYRGYSGSGTGGPMPTAYYARLGTLRIGEAEVNDAITQLLDDHLGPGVENDGNIGTRVLRQFNITIDCIRGVLYLEKNSNWGKPGIFNRAGLVTDSIMQDQKVMTILPGSPSDVAGIKIGDVIMQIDGHSPSDDPLEQNDLAFLQPVGTIVHLTVKRGDRVRKIDVTLRDMF